MEIEWTDPRDGKDWRVYNYNTTPTMAVDSLRPKVDIGEDRISFRHPPDLQNPVEGYSLANPDGHRVDELSDQVVMALLDAAREAAS